jgi:outer membrane protein
MKKTFLLTVALALIAAGAAVAQDAAVAKIAVIDMARVSAESQLGKSYAAQLEKLQTDINTAAQEKQTTLQEMDKAIETLQEELQKQGAVLSQEARESKQQEIVRKGRERQAFLEDGQAEINRMRDRAQQEAQSRARSARSSRRSRRRRATTSCWTRRSPTRSRRISTSPTT